jgi:ABC-2 type transport system permease protein
MLTEQMDGEAKAAFEEAASESGPLAMLDNLKNQNLPYILGLFLFFFFGGYMLYSALFAAIGSAVDNETDTQQLLFPVTIPIIISIVVAQVVIQNPNSSLAFWFSIIPLFSPIVMMVRVPFDPPFWEVALSMGLLVLGFIGAVWMAAKIYRTGILMYGKKPSLKEIGKWLFYKS